MRAAVAIAGVVLATSVLAQVAAGGERASEQARVTIFARPTVVGWAQAATLYGSADGARHEDTVTIEAKDCGSTFFRTYVELHPGSGGGWTTPAATGITSTFRAVWRGATSAPVTIRQRANVVLERRRTGPGFVVAVSAKRSLWRKRVQIQRRTGGRWRPIRTVRLTDSVSSTGVVSFSEATFRLSVPRGGQIRAFLPASEAKPCYVASTSKSIRA